MVVKVYISGISGNKEVKKRQQRVCLILDSKNVQYELIDVAEPNMEEAKEYMQTNSKLMGATIGDPNPRHPLPPQIFNNDEYCGDYEAFDMANETDEMEKFLKLEIPVNNGTTDGDTVQQENGTDTHEDEEKEGKEKPVDEEEKVVTEQEKDANVVEKEKSPTPNIKSDDPPEVENENNGKGDKEVVEEKKEEEEGGWWNDDNN